MRNRRTSAGACGRRGSPEATRSDFAGGDKVWQRTMRHDPANVPAEAAALIAQLQQRVQAQAHGIARREREVAWRDVKVHMLNFELARGTCQ